MVHFFTTWFRNLILIFFFVLVTSQICYADDFISDFEDAENSVEGSFFSDPEPTPDPDPEPTPDPDPELTIEVNNSEDPTPDPAQYSYNDTVSDPTPDPTPDPTLDKLDLLHEDLNSILISLFLCTGVIIGFFLITKIFI